MLLAPTLQAQAPAPAPTIDHVQFVRHSVFDADETSFFLLRLVNKLHVTTQPYVVRREVQVAPGVAWDSAKVAESERSLRSLGIFRNVSRPTYESQMNAQIESAREKKGDGDLAGLIASLGTWTVKDPSSNGG